MLVIGLTGGICSGKTTVANLFSKLGINIIDADVIAREVVEPNTAGYQKIVEHFGEAILTDAGLINRKKLGEIIFNNAQEKKWVEKTLHPLISANIKLQLRQTTSPYCIIVIPLLIETKSFDLVDRILVVDTTEESQIVRAKQRDNLSRAEILKIINSQSAREERLAYADDIIHNQENIEQLKNDVKKMHEFYLLLIQEESNIQPF